MAPPRRPIKHGTQAGYSAHWNRRIPSCRACKTAHASYKIAWRRRKRAADS